ncbi:unnamed protein product [Durusdinium trenchii]|uniref:Protein kinase domain-containing protein n=1 Tax=Durusdinium trenchii TaxID=1381693 RepID=A0ABP0MMU3_9DINO
MVQMAECPCQAYNQMTMEDKKGLLERYKTEGGLKNLQWVNEYFETVTDTTEQKDVAESGWMTPGQIFTLNGFSWEQTEGKKRDKMLAALLKECWDECGIDKPDECTKAHALPELSKYWYSKQKHVQEDKNKVDQTMKLGTNLGMATMQKAIGNSASSSDPKVKLENPSWVQLNSQLQIAAALKGRLEKQVFECTACQKDLEASGKPEFKEFLKSVSDALGKAEAALASLRTNLAQGKDMSVSSDKTDCSTLKKALEGDTNNGSMHLDGLKALCKLVYLALTIPVPQADGSLARRINLAFRIFICSCAGLLGRCWIEIGERASFLHLEKVNKDLTKEKVLRYTAEHEVERGPYSSHSDSNATTPVMPLPDDLASQLTSHASRPLSSIVFTPGASGHDAPVGMQLKAMRAVAAEEKWLIDWSELSFETNLIGKGGFALVMEGNYGGAKVAVKLPQRDQLTTSVEVVDFCGKELRVLRRLRHPFIVTFYGACIEETNRIVLIVEEFVDGYSLFDAILNSKMELSEANRRSILENLGLIPGVVLGLGRNSHQEKAATPCFFARRHHTQLYRLPGASWQLATQ